MGRITSTSCTRNGQARSAMAEFWRWQSGGAAATKEERREFQLGRKKTEFEIKDYHIPVSEASQSPQRHNYYSKTWETHRNPFAAHTTTNTSSGDQLAESAQPLHHRLPRQPASSPQHALPFGIHRDWQHASHSTLCPPKECFVITSFNILASKHAFKHRSLYPTIPFPLLAWDRRRRKVLEKLVSCSPDIVCLQEVDKFKDLEEDLALKGYAGLYKARTGEMSDGCAIFWRKERFQLLQERSFEFSMLGMRDNVAQLCVLQLIVPGLTNSKACSSLLRNEGQVQSYRLVVGNIHVLFNPKRGEIKLGQSAVYKYVATSELDLSNLDRRYLSGLIPEVPTPTLNTVRKEEPSWERSTEIVERSTAEVASQEMAPSPEKVLMEHVGVVNQTKPCASLDPNLEDISEQSNMLEQILESREQKSESRTLVATVLKGAATESLDATIEFTVECAELGPSNHAQTSSDSCSSSTEGPSEYVCSDYGWDAEELRIATGNPDCTRMQHGLNLYSAYSDIQGHNDTRDARGEPLVTTCHKDFLGTVDYIWRNDGLKTMRVLETVPVKAFAKDKALPIRIWGSDHLPLVCELAFM